MIPQPRAEKRGLNSNAVSIPALRLGVPVGEQGQDLGAAGLPFSGSTQFRADVWALQPGAAVHGHDESLQRVQPRSPVAGESLDLYTDFTIEATHWALYDAQFDSFNSGESQEGACHE